MNNPHWIDLLTDEQREYIRSHDRPATYTEDQQMILGRVQSLVFDNISIMPRLMELERKVAEIQKKLKKGGEKCVSK